MTFDPSSADEFTTAVEIPNSDGDEHPYTFTVRGTGTTEAIESNNYLLWTK